MTAPIHSWTSRICNGCHRVIRIRPANSASLIRRSNCCPNPQAAFTSKLSLTSQFSLSNVLINSNMTSQRVDRRHLSTAADKVTTSKPGENLRHPSKSSTSRRRSKLKPKPDPPLTRRTKKETPVWDGSNATSQAIERRDRLLAKERRKRTAKIVGKKKMLDGILEKNAIDHAHNRVEVKNGAESSQKQVRKSIQVSSSDFQSDLSSSNCSQSLCLFVFSLNLTLPKTFLETSSNLFVENSVRIVNSKPTMQLLISVSISSLSFSGSSLSS